jgi:hypothetical protein
MNYADTEEELYKLALLFQRLGLQNKSAEIIAHIRSHSGFAADVESIGNDIRTNDSENTGRERMA